MPVYAEAKFLLEDVCVSQLETQAHRAVKTGDLFVARAFLWPSQRVPFGSLDKMDHV
jgi:hypothetical protein